MGERLDAVWGPTANPRLRPYPCCVAEAKKQCAAGELAAAAALLRSALDG
ncbi:hypothetical protein ITI46_01025 [Streptomyces oryzae]|uniref:Uncharacterized protein n=1 Tax=Streptomyces oryzae TaxID=1434886 RepID=A0ABS3X4K8_9ACTN|nr:hypothetical protein [Streptomyces oryzae]MBO8190305.1 hypothetical protein [Streptomyces oryzae]